MNCATSYHNISVLVNTMACLGGLGLHATMDFDAAVGLDILKYYSILL